MTLFADSQHYKSTASWERNRSLFSGSDRLRLIDAPNARARVSRFNIEAVTIGEVLSTGHEVEVSEPMAVSLIVPIRGRITSTTRSNQIRARAGEALLFSPNSRKTMVESAGAREFLGVPVLIPAGALEQTAERLGFACPRNRAAWNFSTKLSATSAPASQELIQMVNLLYAEIVRKDRIGFGSTKQNAWSQLLHEKIVEVLTEAGVLHGRLESDPAAASRHVRRATEYLYSNYDQILGVADIANSCGISIRSLQDAFRSVWSMTPLDFLLAIRLDAAREMLIRSDGEKTVTEVALACGLSHLGRFSVAYRERFGELPSETLRRRVALP